MRGQVESRDGIPIDVDCGGLVLPSLGHTGWCRRTTSSRSPSHLMGVWQTHPLIKMLQLLEGEKGRSPASASRSRVYWQYVHMCDLFLCIFHIPTETFQYYWAFINWPRRVHCIGFE